MDQAALGFAKQAGVPLKVRKAINQAKQLIEGGARRRSLRSARFLRMAKQDRRATHKAIEEIEGMIPRADAARRAGHLSDDRYRLGTTRLRRALIVGGMQLRKKRRIEGDLRAAYEMNKIRRIGRHGLAASYAAVGLGATSLLGAAVAQKKVRRRTS